MFDHLEEYYRNSKKNKNKKKMRVYMVLADAVTKLDVCMDFERCF